MIDYKEQLTRLLNKVNAVTAPHRHGREVRKKELDELSNRQIEVEKVLASQCDSAASTEHTCWFCGRMDGKGIPCSNCEKEGC